MNLYTDNDPFCCEWLRKLVYEKKLPNGNVLERDIRKLTETELHKFDQIHFFSGIGGWPFALKLAGWTADLPVWSGSCPCQPFSVAGRGAGTRDERHLWPAWFQLIREFRPATIFGEQIASPAARAWLDIVFADLEGAGYACGAANLCACGVGAPHLRQRIYWVALADREQHKGIGLCLQQGEPQKEDAATDRCGEVDGVADASQFGYKRSTESVDPGQGTRGSTGGESQTSPMADSSDRQQRDRKSETCGQWEGENRGHGFSGPMGNTDEGRGGRNARGLREAQGGPALWAEESTGETHGAWSDADWLACRDGKFRAAQSGSFPLSHGLPFGMGRLCPRDRELAEMAGCNGRNLREAKRNRVGRIRGYGNTIVPQLAAVFVRAVMEVIENE